MSNVQERCANCPRPNDCFTFGCSKNWTVLTAPQPTVSRAKHIVIPCQRCGHTAERTFAREHGEMDPYGLWSCPTCLDARHRADLLAHGLAPADYSIEMAVRRMRAWAKARPSALADAVLDDEWDKLARAALGVGDA